jgi:hypothetical protein
MAGRDRRALRAVPLVAAVAGFFVAGHEALPRLTAAFDWRGPALAAAAVRIDAWIDPPSYTRMPPILIDFGRLAGPNFNVPEKSTVVVRIAGKSGMDVATTGRLDAVPVEGKPGEAKSGDTKPAEDQGRADEYGRGDGEALSRRRRRHLAHHRLGRSGADAQPARDHRPEAGDRLHPAAEGRQRRPRRARPQLPRQGRLRHRLGRGAGVARRTDHGRPLAGRGAQAGAAGAAFRLRRETR